jgi:aldehyde dehydrogenase (NAD+)
MSEFMREAAAVGGPIDAATPAADAVSAERVLALFRSQQAHQWTIRQRPIEERIRKLKALKRSIVAHREEILDAMHADFRKNRSEAELSEIQLVFTELNEAIAQTAEWARPATVATPIHLFGTRSEIRYQPRGVVLIMAAWNYPFALIFAPLVAAVAAGNCVMMRPSEKVPNTSRVCGKIVAEVFDPEEAVLIGGDQSTAKALLDLPFDHVFFTGSSPVGRKIMAAAATHLSSVTLELGGKSPVIVDETADIPYAAQCIVWGKFVNAGQTCVAPDYAFVHASQAGAFFDAAREALATAYGAADEERQASEDYCRMIDDSNTRRVQRLIEEAVRDGAKLEAGGQVDAAERYIAPTILSGVRPDATVMQDEIFGPVLPVLTYQSREEIYGFLRSRPKPLALYIFSRQNRNIEELVGSTSAGGTVVNNCLMHLLNPNLPFGGAGASGFGSYHGRFGFQAFSQERAVLVQGRPRLSHLFYPPYARLKTGWLGSIIALARRLRD